MRVLAGPQPPLLAGELTNVVHSYHLGRDDLVRRVIALMPLSLDPMTPQERLADELARMQFEGHGEGHKSSEGDGRTAADIEAENARKATEDSE